MQSRWAQPPDEQPPRCHPMKPPPDEAVSEAGAMSHLSTAQAQMRPSALSRSTSNGKQMMHMNRTHLFNK